MLFVFSNPENLNGQNCKVEIFTVGYAKLAQLDCSLCNGPRLQFKWDGLGGSRAAGTGYYYALFKAGEGSRRAVAKFMIIP